MTAKTGLIRISSVPVGEDINGDRAYSCNHCHTDSPALKNEQELIEWDSKHSVIRNHKLVFLCKKD